MTARSTTYRRFMSAATAGNKGQARRHVAAEFRAVLDKEAPDLKNMTFAQLMQELTRQRIAFPDLGKQVRVINTTEDGDKLVVTYMLTVTFNGPLRSRDGKRSVPPTGAKLSIPSQDHVTFDAEGKIIKLEVVTDMGHTLEQMFS